MYVSNEGIHTATLDERPSFILKLLCNYAVDYIMCLDIFSENYLV